MLPSMKDKIKSQEKVDDKKREMTRKCQYCFREKTGTTARKTFGAYREKKTQK